MTGEMYSIHPTKAQEPDGTIWPLHKAIVQALIRRGYSAHVEPFDQYQGPYIVIGPEFRAGRAPYVVPIGGVGIKRLWVAYQPQHPDMAQVYREDTDKASNLFWLVGGRGDSIRAVRAALSLL